MPPTPSGRYRSRPVTDLAVRPALAVSAPLPPLDEETKRRNLARMKRRASGLLLLATAVWVVSLLLIGRYPWLAYVRGATRNCMILPLVGLPL